MSRRMIRRLVQGTVALLGVALLAVVLAQLWLQRYLDAPLNLPEEGAVVEVQPGQSLGAVARRLQAEGRLQHARVFARWARWQGGDQRIHVGEYRLTRGLTPRRLLDQLVRGEVLLHSITVVEGWRFVDMRLALAAHPAVNASGLSDEEIMQALGAPERHPEGLFFPDTYRFPRGTPELDLLQQAHRRMQSELDAAWAERGPDLPLADPYEALILASIIEKETALESERERIAGVFTRRLQIGMRLQTDPTVIYGAGDDYSGRLTRQNLDTDTPYNTYTRHGLPPTPIALPGRESLRAAVNPADGDELYFVATGETDGSHYFSRTLEEHNRAVARYLQRMRERNP